MSRTYKNGYPNEITVSQFTEVPKDAVLGWHFLSKDSTLSFIPKIKIKTGTLLTMTCEPILCKQGLHYSENLSNALGYAGSSILSRVWLGGKIVEDSNKGVAQQRGVLWVGDVSDILQEFACSCAEKTLIGAGGADKLLWDALVTKRAWLKGKMTNKQLIDAYLAICSNYFTYNPGQNDSYYKICSTVRCATLMNAWEAAYGAAEMAGYCAASITRQNTSWDVDDRTRRKILPNAWSIQNELLTKMIEKRINNDKSR